MNDQSADGATIVPLADAALLVQLGTTIDREVNARALRLATALANETLIGVLDIVPAYTTVLVSFDPVLTDAGTIEEVIRRVLPRLADHDAPSRTREIPVRYGGSDGPDLADVAAHTGLSPEKVIALHAAADYQVACVGFCPGFGFLLGLPTRLETPRRATPRLRVPLGSVAIGGAQTGVYPLETPGGWNIIGRTDLLLFDPNRDDPFYLRPGDRVRFVPGDGVGEPGSRGVGKNGEADADFIAPPIGNDRGSAPPVPANERPGPGAESHTTAVSSASGDHLHQRQVTVLDGGAQATVQDLGRPGLMHLGVSPGGALDRRALVLGNRLLGNEPGDAAIEIALSGPRLRFDTAALAGVTGADLGPLLDGRPVPLWQPIAIAAGQTLSFVAPAHPGSGLRTYVCVDGGVAIPPLMGSRATDLFGKIGGLEGRALRATDQLPLGPAANDPAAILSRQLANPAPLPTIDDGPIRVVLGPQAERFTAAGITTLLTTGWTVSLHSDRIGLRLDGPPIELVAGADAISEGIAAGSIQVPGDGRPIALLPARQTVGGYPKIAVVIDADLDRLGQLVPGDTVRFSAVDLDEARRHTCAARAALGPEAVIAGQRTTTIRRETGVASTERDFSIGDEPWDPAAVERVIRVVADTGATRFRLELHGLAPLTLEWERTPADSPARPVPVGPAADAAPPSESAAPDATEQIVTAPLLGVFYRRPAPEQPPLVEEGQQVVAGTVLGLIEVMKTYHEVTAPGAGQVAEFLVADGATVQFGEPLVRLG